MQNLATFFQRPGHTRIAHTFCEFSLKKITTPQIIWEFTVRKEKRREALMSTFLVVLPLHTCNPRSYTRKGLVGFLQKRRAQDVLLL